MMRDLVPGVSRKRRGDERPPREYDLYVDGERAGWAERLTHGKWRFYYSAVGDWATFARPGAFAAGEQWLADLHRSARARNTQVSVVVTAEVREVMDPVVASPFGADLFADPSS